MIDVIIDTDIGDDIDDFWALAYILSKKEYNVVLIAATHGNTSYKRRLVLKLLDRLGKKTIPVVSGKPSFSPCPEEKWLEDFQDEQNEPMSYCCAMKKAVEEHPNALLILLGPTNDFYEFLLHSSPKVLGMKCLCMGGAINDGYINETSPGPESNFAFSPVASSYLLNNMTNLTLVPLDVTRSFIISGNDYFAVKKSHKPSAVAVIENYLLWNKEYTGGALKYNPNESSSILYDLVVPLIPLFPERFGFKKYSLSVTPNGSTVVNGPGRVNVCLESYEQGRNASEVAEVLSRG